MHLQTAYRWFHNGTLPVPAVRVNERTILVSPDTMTERVSAGFGLYARASSHDLAGCAVSRLGSSSAHLSIARLVPVAHLSKGSSREQS